MPPSNSPEYENQARNNTQKHAGDSNSKIVKFTDALTYPQGITKKLMLRKTPEVTYFFTKVEHDILKSVCTYMVGISEDTPVDTPIIVIDTFVRQLPKTLGRQFRFGLHLFQWGPPLFLGKPCRFTQLVPRDAVKYIEGWAKSRFSVRRRLFRGLRDIAFLGFYSNQPSGD